MAETLKSMQIVKKCEECGQKYNIFDWCALPLLKSWEESDEDGGIFEEVACVCGASLVINWSKW